MFTQFPHPSGRCPVASSISGEPSASSSSSAGGIRRGAHAELRVYRGEGRILAVQCRLFIATAAFALKSSRLKSFANREWQPSAEGGEIRNEVGKFIQ